MIKKMAMTTAFAGALSLAALSTMTGGASAQGTGTEPPKAPSPSGGGAMPAGGGMMKKPAGGAMMKKPGGGAMMKKHGGGAMMKKH